jgi:hypothetical protein
MTVDIIELLRATGAVEPLDQNVLDAALRTLAEAADQDANIATARSRSGRRYPRLIAAGVAAALALGATSAVVARVAHDARAAAPLAGLGGEAQSAAAPGTSAGPSRAAAVAPTIAAILTAVTLGGADILEVTKTMSGDAGTLGKTVIWISPADPAPGTTVRSRIQQFTLAGASQADTAITYSAPPAAASVPTGSGCGGMFGRPRAVAPPAPGLPGTMSTIDYLGKLWATGAVSVQAATVPSLAGLRTCLQEGQWVAAGHEVLGNAHVIELVSASGYEHLWVSPATLLPVRLVASSPGTDTFTFTFAFLPPTVANQAMLTLPSVPAGFSRVSISQGD